jgi:hypothetical protein
VSENTPKSDRKAPRTAWPKGKSGNPGGRPKKTDDERAAENYLRERSEAAAQRLVELQSSADDKVALGACLGHLKITVGTLERQADPDGKPRRPLAGARPDLLLKLIEELKK